MENNFDYTKKVSYFLWEKTGYDKPLELWKCAEAMGKFLKGNDLNTVEKLDVILSRNYYDDSYIYLMRTMSFLVYKTTQNEDQIRNWYIVEDLFKSNEFKNAIVKI